MEGPSYLFFSYLLFPLEGNKLFFLNPFSLPVISVPDPDLLDPLLLGFQDPDPSQFLTDPDRPILPNII
jgi:hypothetical protein